MSETPKGDTGEAFGLLDPFIGASPFVFLVGMVAGLAAAALVYPVVSRAGAGFAPVRVGWRRQFRVPAVVGGVGSLLSLWTEVTLRPMTMTGWLVGRLFVVGAALSAVAWYVTFRDTDRNTRLTSLWCYAAFVVVWTAFVGALYAAWL